MWGGCQTGNAGNGHSVRGCVLLQVKGLNVKKISRKVFIVGGAAAAVAAGACLCTKTGRATLTGVGDTPEISDDAYDVTGDKSVRIHLDRVTALASVGGAIKMRDPDIGDSLIVARVANDAYVAASIKCTHRGVEVEYHADDKCFECASLGGSRFKTSGERIGGFAKRPLRTYPVSLEGGVLVIQLS